MGHASYALWLRRLPIGAHPRPCRAVAGERRKLACAASSLLTSRTLRVRHACVNYCTGLLHEICYHSVGFVLVQ